MPTDPSHHEDTDIVLPRLSDDAVVQIHGFIEQLLALFESRYAAQIRRFYDGMSEHDMIDSGDRRDVDEPPF